MKKWLFILLLLGGLGAWWLWPDGGKRYPPGILVATPPQQVTVDRPLVWTLDTYTIEALASYNIRARVLSREGYWLDRESDVSPFDFFLGWGPMSDQAVLDKMEFKHRSRWVYWRYREEPLPQRDIIRHSANTHLVPATDEVREQLKKVQIGDIVRLKGYLVEITNEDGWTWKSSLSRTDERGKACELMWVERVEID